MKTTLHVQTLRVKLRGASAADATAAVRDLGPAVATALAGRPAGATPSPSVPVRTVLAAKTAGALRAHLPPIR